MKDRVFLTSSVLLVVAGSVTFNVALNPAQWGDRPRVSEWMPMPTLSQGNISSPTNTLAAATIAGPSSLDDRPLDLGLQARSRPPYIRRTSR